MNRDTLNVLRASVWLLVEVDRTEPSLRTTDHLAAIFSLRLRQQYLDTEGLRFADEDAVNQVLQKRYEDLAAWFDALMREAQAAGEN